MRHMKEKIQSKLYSMASILLDNIIVPEQLDQEGTDTITASYFDEAGNKYTFTLSLNVIPQIKVNDVIADVDEPITLADQITTILEKLTTLENDVGILKTYHNYSPNIDEEDDTSGE